MLLQNIVTGPKQLIIFIGGVFNCFEDLSVYLEELLAGSETSPSNNVVLSAARPENLQDTTN